MPVFDETASMLFEDEVELATDKQTLWNAVSDPAILIMCVPGAKEVNEVTDRVYTGVIERGVAGITMSLDGKAEITELEEPDRLVAIASGQDTNTNSRVEAEIEMTIDEMSDTTSMLQYSIDFDFTGRLASIGSRIAKRKISSDISTFIDNLQSHVEN